MTNSKKTTTDLPQTAEDVPTAEVTMEYLDALRKAAGLQIDPETAEVEWTYADVQEMNLQSESAAKTKSRPSVIQMLTSGATADEAEYLLRKRVELNAMHSAQLVAFIERKLDQEGIKKVIPDKERLDKVYRLFERDARLQQAFKRVEKGIKTASDVPVPDDLDQRVAHILKLEPKLRWDAAVQKVLDPTRSDMTDITRINDAAEGAQRHGY